MRSGASRRGNHLSPVSPSIKNADQSSIRSDRIAFDVVRGLDPIISPRIRAITGSNAMVTAVVSGFPDLIPAQRNW
jgi:hypothetical protein